MLTATLTVTLTVSQTAMLAASSLQFTAESDSIETDCQRGANPAKPHQAALGAVSGCWGWVLGVEVAVGYFLREMELGMIRRVLASWSGLHLLSATLPHTLDLTMDLPLIQRPAQ